MPILRSRKIIFKPSTDKTLETETPMNPSTPSKSEAMATASASSTPSPSSGAAAPCRRSLRLASITPPASDAAIATRKRKARVSESPNGGEIRVSEASGSTNLRSGTRIAKRQAKVEGVDESSLESVAIGSESRASRLPNEEEVRVLEERGSMRLRSSARIATRQVSAANDEEGGEVGLEEGIDFEEKLKRVDECETIETNEIMESVTVKSETRVENSGPMTLRSSTRPANRSVKLDNENHVEIDLQAKFDFGAKLKSVGESQMEESCEVVESVLESETVGIERLRYEAKGKGQLVFDVDCIEKAKNDMVIDKEKNGKGKFVLQEDNLSINNNEVMIEDIKVLSQEIGEGSGKHRRGRKVITRMTTVSRKEAERNLAIKLAPEYALFKAEEDRSEEEEQKGDLLQNENQKEDWPGPFSTAMKIIRDREQMLIARELDFSSKKDDDIAVKIQWIPSNDRKLKPLQKRVPSLHDLCMKFLCENAEEIECLDGVPDVIKHRLVSHLCRVRKMGSRVLGLLFSGSPSEIHLSDLSWATEVDLEGAFGRCNTETLKVVELDLCGRCLPDFILQGVFARSPNSLPLLTKMSLKGNYRLSDDGLNAIVTSAPLLSSVNLCQCSLITSAGIIGLADKLELVLRELYIDDCQDVDAMSILPALVKFKHLEVLSVAGIETVNDKFVKTLVSVCGSTMKELVFAGCRKLTDASVKAIGESCSDLRSLDLRNLNRLNDSAMGHLANGCRSIQKLKLRRNTFSDEAVAAFLELSGGSLYELSLNNVEKVGQQTAISISRRCSSNLKSLDVSFCRNLTNEALGLIVDSCSSLQVLKLFGCTQITNIFLEGHSNSMVKIVGSNGAILDQFEFPLFL